MQGVGHGRDRSLIERCRFVPQEVDSMRCAYYSDLCSKFMIENTILKMEYAEVRVFSISDKVQDSKSDNRFYLLLSLCPPFVWKSSVK